MVGKPGFSLTHENKRMSNRNIFLMLHIFQQNEIKMGTDYRFRKNQCNYFSFLPKSRTNFPSSGRLFIIKTFVTTRGADFSSNRNLL